MAPSRFLPNSISCAFLRSLTANQKQVSLKLYDTRGSAFWQRSFEMAFRAACLVKREAYASDEMLACRDQFRGISLMPPPASTRRRIRPPAQLIPGQSRPPRDNPRRRPSLEALAY